jgi:hypothetical protein
MVSADGMTIITWLAAVAIVAAGAAVQGSIGFGLGIVGAPLLALLDPRLVPGPVLLAALLLTGLVAWRDWHAVRGADLAWTVPGRLLGTAVAVLVLRVVPADRFEIPFALLILAAVGLTAAGPALPFNRGTLFGAGSLAGLMGTITSIGGPPMALVYQREEGARLRGTLAAFFAFGVVISLGGLAVAGRFGWTEAALAVALMPGVLLGFLLSRWTAGRLDRRATRIAVLVLSAGSAAILLVKELLPHAR